MSTNKRAANYREGRSATRHRLHGRIYGRVNVGLCEKEWRYVVELARETGGSISDVVRWAIEADRQRVEKEVFNDETIPPWHEDAIVAKRFAHVEITED